MDTPASRLGQAPVPESNLSSTWPAPPWHLCGGATLRLQPIPVERVRSQIPPGLSLVTIAPGRTLGGIYIAEYGAGSTREYHELIVIAALVRRGMHVGGWVSHIYVDDPVSQAAGQEIWGLPKQLATFARRDLEEGTRIQVDDATDGSHLCTLTISPRNSWLRMPLMGPLVTQKESSFLSVVGKGSAATVPVHSQVEVGPHSPFAGLGLTSGSSWKFGHLKMDLPAPEILRGAAH